MMAQIILAALATAALQSPPSPADANPSASLSLEGAAQSGPRAGDEGFRLAASEDGKALLIEFAVNESERPKWAEGLFLAGAIDEAGRRWGRVCPVAIRAVGTTDAIPIVEWTDEIPDSRVDLVNKIGWGSLAGTKHQGLNAAETFVFLAESKITVQSDITVESSIPLTPRALVALLVHETGHSIGIDHTDQRPSVMNSNPYPPVEIMGHPQLLDIVNCRKNVARRILELERAGLARISMPANKGDNASSGENKGSESIGGQAAQP